MAGVLLVATKVTFVVGVVKMAQSKVRASGSELGFEAELFKAADKLRGNMEPSDYKHVALGLMFLKYISDAFEARHTQLLAEDPIAAEDPDEYLAENVFWVTQSSSILLPTLFYFLKNYCNILSIE